MGELVVKSPYDGRELQTIATQDVNDVNDALATAHALFRNRDAWLSIPERLAILNKTAEIMQSQVEELTLLAASEGGKPYADSKVEVLRAIDGVHLCAEGIRAHAGSVIALGTTAATTGRTAFTQKEPIGDPYCLTMKQCIVHIRIHLKVKMFTSCFLKISLATQKRYILNYQMF